jgi:pimeloyl-ACP methyl ester carboxylesterase
MMLGWIIALLLLVAIAGGGLAYFSWKTAQKVKAAIPPIGKFIEVDGGRLHYVDRGQGAPIVMIHGLGGTLQHYTATIADEIARTNRVIILDRPGGGYSERPAGADATTITQAGIIQRAIEKLGVTDPLIVGHSLGGAVALAHAVGHQGKARGYVLLAPLARVPDQPPPMFKRLHVPSPLMQRIIAWTIGVPLGIKYGRQITTEVFAPQPVTADFATASGGFLGLRPKQILTNMMDFNATTPAVRELPTHYKDIAAPVLCVFGVEDRVLMAEFQLAALSAIPGIEIQRLQGAGHMLMHNEPSAVIAAIRKLDASTRREPLIRAVS